MKKFKTAQLRSETSSIFNEVMVNGPVLITHRDRPEMVLMLKDKFRELSVKAHSADQAHSAE